MIIKESESKYFQAIRKLKFNDHQRLMSHESTALHRLKYKALHGNKGVEKALETASKICQSDLLKIGL